MFSLHDILWMIFIPALAGLLLAGAGAFLKRRAWLTPIAMGIGMLVAFPVITGNPGFPRIPPDPSLGLGSKGWIPAVALIAIAAGLLDSLIKLPAIVRALLTGIATAAALALLLKFKFGEGEDEWTTGKGAGYIALLGAIAIAWFAAIEDATSKAPITSMIICWLIASCTAVIVMLISTLEYGQFSLTVAAPSAAMAIILLWRGAPGALRGATMTYSVLMICLLSGAYYLSELGTDILALLMVPPLFVWLGRWAPAKWKAWMRGTARIVVTLIPLATAATIAGVRVHRAELQEKQDASEGDSKKDSIYYQ